MIVFQVVWGEDSAYEKMAALSGAAIRWALAGCDYRLVRADDSFGKLRVALNVPRALVVDVDLIPLARWQLHVPSPEAPIHGVRAARVERLARQRVERAAQRKFINGGLLSYGARHRAIMERAIELGPVLSSKWYEETCLNIAMLELGHSPVRYHRSYNYQAPLRQQELGYHPNYIREPEAKLDAMRTAAERFGDADLVKSLRKEGVL